MTTRVAAGCLVLLPILLPAFAVGLGWAAPEAAPTGTFSIVAVDSVTGELGVAVQSRAFSVGSSVAWAEAGVGAIATQAQTNQAFGPTGLDLLRQGLGSREAIERLLADDPGRENRQVGIIDAAGRAVNHTGSGCQAWAGGRTGRGYACQGNILVSEEVVASMARAFETTQGELAERLLAALEAAQQAGGDKRGKQSAALLVVRPSEDRPQYRYRYIDLRVEDHPDPIKELARLYEMEARLRLVDAHVHYAEYYTRTGSPDLADHERDLVGAMLVKALADSAADAEHLNNLAWACATADLYLPEALEAARRAVALSPEAPTILDTLAEAYFRSGMTEEAIETAEKAARLDPQTSYYKEQLERFRKAGH